MILEKLAMKKAAIAVLLAVTGVAYSTILQAATLSTAGVEIRRGDFSIMTQVRSKTGPLLQNSGHLRTFRPSQAERIRPVIAQPRVRPGRPLAHRTSIRPPNPKRKQHGPHAYRMRPHPFYVHVTEPVPPEVISIRRDHRSPERWPLTPDFCRYWGDRGDISGDVCW